jgi:hypothetical protein
MTPHEPVHAVALPASAHPPYRVYVNGEERLEGEGYRVEGGTLRLTPPLRPRPPLGLWRKVLLAIGIGVYGDLRGDTLDVTYRAADGTTRTVTVPLTSPAPGGAATPPRG